MSRSRLQRVRRVDSPVGVGTPISRDEDADRHYDQEGDRHKDGVKPDSFLIL
jgi:hypothetical protein